MHASQLWLVGFRRRAIMLMAALAGTVMLLVGSTALASASPAGNSIDVNGACRMQYGNGSSTDVLIVSNVQNWLDPYSWYCERMTSSSSGAIALGLPVYTSGVSTYQPLGGVNLQAWCSKYYPGTLARVASGAEIPVWGWECLGQ